jgi:hypothetical protein
MADRGITARIERPVCAGGFEVDRPARGALWAGEVDLAASTQLLPALGPSAGQPSGVRAAVGAGAILPARDHRAGALQGSSEPRRTPEYAQRPAGLPALVRASLACGRERAVAVDVRADHSGLPQRRLQFAEAGVVKAGGGLHGRAVPDARDAFGVVAEGDRGRRAVGVDQVE